MSKQPSRASESIAAVFHRCFFIIFIVLFFLIAFVGYLCVAIVGESGTLSLPWYEIALRFLFLLLSFAAIAVILVQCRRLMCADRFSRLDERRLNTRVILIVIGLMFLLQLTFAYLLRMRPVTDVHSVEMYAKTIAQSGSFDCLSTDLTNHYYIVRYPNNLPYLLIVTAFYRVTYLLSGTLSRAPILIFNTIALNASVLMTVLTARRLFGERRAIYTLLLCVLFTPYYTYAAYYYTDSFSLPLVIGVIYTFVVAAQSKTRGKKIGFLLLSGLLCGIGFEIKATVGILLIAVVIYALIRYGFKRALKFAAPVLLSFAVVAASYTAAVKAADLIPDELADRHQYPVTHWIMMGLGNDKDILGGYSYPDSELTRAQGSKAEKTALNLEEIKKRITDRGFFGGVYHLGLKAVWSWMDGTYYIGYYLRNYCQQTFLHSFVLYDGELRFLYYGAASGFQLFLILMMAYSSLDACRKRRIDLTLLLRIAVIGLWLFLLIWETNSRYPFQFSPLYLLLATDGIGDGRFTFRIRKTKHMTDKKADSSI